MDIDAVEQRAADLAQVALDHAGRAAALAAGVAVETALAPVQITTATSINPECRHWTTAGFIPPGAGFRF